MQELTTKLILGLWMVLDPSIFSILTSLVASIYFLSMLKVNVIDKKYNGSWKQYFKSILKKR